MYGISHCYQWGQSISVLRVTGGEGYFFIFIRILKDCSVNSTGYPYLTPCSAVSDLGLHCLHVSHKKVFMLVWVNVRFKPIF